MGRKRRNFTAEDKVRLLKRHFVEKESVSDICDKENIQPTQFYQWQRQFFENGATAFERKAPKKQDREAQKVKVLEDKLGVKVTKLPQDPQVAGAVGAALIAMEKLSEPS